MKGRKKRSKTEKLRERKEEKIYRRKRRMTGGVKDNRHVMGKVKEGKMSRERERK